MSPSHGLEASRHASRRICPGGFNYEWTKGASIRQQDTSLVNPSLLFCQSKQVETCPFYVCKRNWLDLPLDRLDLIQMHSEHSPDA